LLFIICFRLRVFLPDGHSPFSLTLGWDFGLKQG
jgi:hypothetical protein